MVGWAEGSSGGLWFDVDGNGSDAAVELIYLPPDLLAITYKHIFLNA